MGYDFAREALPMTLLQPGRRRGFSHASPMRLDSVA